MTSESVFEPGRMAAEIEKGNIKVGRFNPRQTMPSTSRVRRTRQRFRDHHLVEKSYDAGSNGTNILKCLLGSSGLFDFPKSLYAARDALATVVGSRPDALTWISLAVWHHAARDASAQRRR